eukprot:2901694-Rhodomonas_salina.1
MRTAKTPRAASCARVCRDTLAMAQLAWKRCTRRRCVRGATWTTRTALPGTSRLPARGLRRVSAEHRSRRSRRAGFTCLVALEVPSAASHPYFSYEPFHSFPPPSAARHPYFPLHVSSLSPLPADATLSLNCRGLVLAMAEQVCVCEWSLTGAVSRAVAPSPQVYYNDLYEYHIPSRTWTDLSSPSAPRVRAGGGMAVFDGKLYVFAGRFAGDSKCFARPCSRKRCCVCVWWRCLASCVCLCPPLQPCAACGIFLASRSRPC